MKLLSRKNCKIKVGQHGTMLKQIPMEFKAAGQVMAQVSWRGRFHIVVEVVAIGRVRTVVNQSASPFQGRRSATPCSVTTTRVECSLWSMCVQNGTIVEILPPLATEGQTYME